MERNLKIVSIAAIAGLFAVTVLVLAEQSVAAQQTNTGHNGIPTGGTGGRANNFANAPSMGNTTNSTNNMANATAAKPNATG